MALILIWISLACKTDDAVCSDVVGSDAALEVKRREHPWAWGVSDCWQCHQVWTIHDTICSTAIDGTQINKDLADGKRWCADCHGPMGVEP